jgi:hypothetical protein
MSPRPLYLPCAREYTQSFRDSTVSQSARPTFPTSLRIGGLSFARARVCQVRHLSLRYRLPVAVFPRIWRRPLPSPHGPKYRQLLSCTTFGIRKFHDAASCGVFKVKIFHLLKFVSLFYYRWDLHGYSTLNLRHPNGYVGFIMRHFHQPAMP